MEHHFKTLDSNDQGRPGPDARCEVQVSGVVGMLGECLHPHSPAVFPQGVTGQY